MAQEYIPTVWAEGGPPSITADRLNNMELGILLASAPVVGALPANPADFQECILRVQDGSFKTIAFWHFVYCADEPGSYKWICTGGVPLYSNVDGNSVITGAAWNNYGGPSITVPVAGDFEVTIGGRSINDIGGGGTDVTQSYTVGGSTPLAPDGNDLYTPSAQAAIQQANTRVKTGIAAGTAIAERVWTNGGNAGISARFLRVMPRRVG